MKLLYARPSPLARKARVAILEKGLEDRVELTPVDPFADDPALLKINPLSKVPALVLDDGSHLIDSVLICLYLDTLSERNPLMPQGPERFAQLQRAYVAHGVIEAAVAHQLESRRPEEALRSSFWLERQVKAIERALVVLETEASKLDAPVDIVQITCGVALAYLDFRMPQLNWRASQPNLATWSVQFNLRPSMLATVPEPTN